MSIFNALTDTDKKNIINYVSSFAGLDGDAIRGSMCPLETYLRHWAIEKECLFHMMGDQLRITRHIEYIKDSAQLESDIEELRSWGDDTVIGSFIREYYDYIHANYNGWHDRCGYAMRALMDNDALISNKYEGDTVVFVNGKEETYKLQSGAKVSKALGKLVELFELNKENFEAFRIRHSQILNEKTLSGNLTLSIHPLDFMTASDNDCNWRSCMNWRDGGEYRRGTVELMNSPCVVEAYIESSEPFVIKGCRGNFEWANKKWREFFVVDESLLAGIKGYPYWNRDLEKITLSWIKEICEANHFGSYHDDIISAEFDDGATEVSISVEEATAELDVTFCTNAMYNDFLYTHNLIFSKNLYNLETSYSGRVDLCGSIEITYSGNAVCPVCGEDYYYADFEDESALVCEKCDRHYTCARCGDPIYDDDCYIVDGDRVCPDCYENLPVSDISGEKHLRSCMTECFVDLEEDFDKVSQINILISYEEAEAIGKHEYLHYLNSHYTSELDWSHNWVVPISKLPEELQQRVGRTESIAPGFFRRSKYEPIENYCAWNYVNVERP